LFQKLIDVQQTLIIPLTREQSKSIEKKPFL
jgi:hypothetical protein